MEGQSTPFSYIPDHAEKPYANTLIRAGNYYSCQSGWTVPLRGDKHNATLRIGSIRFQAFPDRSAPANFTGHGKFFGMVWFLRQLFPLTPFSTQKIDQTSR